MTLLKHTYSTPVERALEPLRWDSSVIPILVDNLYNGNEEATLPYVADMYLADLYTTLLGENFERASLENAGFFALYRGTQAAIDRFAQITGAIITHTISGNSITYRVAPPFSSGTRQPVLDNYFTEALTKLTPFYLTVAEVDTVDFFEGTQRISGGFGLEEIVA